MNRHSVLRLVSWLALGAAIWTWAPAARAAGVPDGEYGCYVMLRGIANIVGTLQLKGATYATKNAGEKGQYVFEPAGQVLDFKGPPPLGFKVGVLETDKGKTLIRLYKERAKIGNKWGALFCSPKT